MGVEIKIVIPSYQRPDKVYSMKAISNALICIPESEYSDYARNYDKTRIVCHPDSIKGLALKRQWIYEQFGNVFMVDDDCKAFTRLYVSAGELADMNADEAYEIIQYIGNCAKLAGCYLFGINTNVNPIAYSGLKPIRLTGFLNGTIGLLEGSELYFPQSAGLVDDYFVSGLNAYIYRKCWIDDRFSVKCADTFVAQGGSAMTRTLDQEERDTLFLRKVFGEAVLMKQDTQIAKRKHEFQRTMKIPY